MKKKLIIGMLVPATFGAGLCGYYLGRYQEAEANKYQVAYVDTEVVQEQLSTNQEKTPEQISAEEGIDAEQIVVKITDQGYVTSHGDHFHYYNGKVPYDALISEELLMKDPNYVLQEAHIVNEVKDGWIIKVNGRYYLYLRDKKETGNVRTLEQIAQQSQGQQKGHTAQAKGGQQQGRYRTDDGYIFNASDIIEDTGDGYIVTHGDHFHFIPKKDLSPEELQAAQTYWASVSGKTPTQAVATAPKNRPATPSKPAPQPISPTIRFSDYDIPSLLKMLDETPLAQRYVEADGLVFDPRKITKRTTTGVVVPHGDHFHFIPYSKLSPLEAYIARNILLTDQLFGVAGHPLKKIKGQPTHPAITSKPKQKKPAVSSKSAIKTVSILGKTYQSYGKGLDGKPYMTSDGYVFSKSSIYDVDEQGVFVSHGNHFHYIGFGELEASEAKEVETWIRANKQKIDTLTTPPDESDGKKPVFSYKFVTEKIKKDGKWLYVVALDGKTYTYLLLDLDLQQRAFAELTLMEKNPKEYRFEIATLREGDLAPALLVDAKSIPEYGAHATVDTGESFVIPHLDHIHILPYSWLSKEQIATIRYIMQHPECRPNSWDAAEDELPPVTLTPTPVDQRDGLANWQIVYTAEEVAEAKADGRYTTEDGYIFDPMDVADPQTQLTQDGYRIPLANGSGYRLVLKRNLNYFRELLPAESQAAKKDLQLRLINGMV